MHVGERKIIERVGEEGEGERGEWRQDRSSQDDDLGAWPFVADPDIPSVSCENQG